MNEDPIRDLHDVNEFEPSAGNPNANVQLYSGAPHSSEEGNDGFSQENSFEDMDKEEPLFCPPIKWKKVNGSQGPAPRPRHGHRAVAIKDLILIFGGGNEGIVDDLHVFNTVTNQWFVPHVRGDIPSGAAAFGFAVNGTSLFMFGGMVEFGKYSSELYELQASRWEWRKMRPRPKPPAVRGPTARLGHSFVMTKGSIGYVFGGLTNDAADPKMNEPRYLCDLWLIDLKHSISNQFWEELLPEGPQPQARESHSACILETPTRREMIIYGGMNGTRLGDIWILDLNKNMWTNVLTDGVAPLPRSLHTANVIGERMYVYGGWVPLTMDNMEEGEMQDKEWKCTNTLGVLNINNWCWENTGLAYFDSGTIETFPRARAGHCSVVVHNRLYIWSGRDGYRKAWNNQVCCRDMWFLETEKPGKPTKVQLIRAQVNQLEVSWAAVNVAEAYLIQLVKIEPEKDAAKQTPTKDAKLPGSSPLMKAVKGSPALSGQEHIFRVVKQPVGLSGAARTPGGATKAIIIAKSPSGTPNQKVLILPSNADNAPGSSQQAATFVPSTPSQGDDSGLPQNFIEGGSDDAPDSRSDPPTDPKSSTGSESEPPTEMKDISVSQPLTDLLPNVPPPEEVWHDVGIVKGNSLSVSHYFLPGECSLESSYVLDYENNGIHAGEEGYTRKEPLLPGTTYKFRIAGLNSIGRGAWSDEVLFKTCLPGFPGAPSSIKITKNDVGANITWEPPANTAGRISEYSVYLAVRNSAADSQLGFTRVYTGIHPECTVQQSVLSTAHMEGGVKPAIIFRIAAKNEKGYGPATQVRWLQDQRAAPPQPPQARPPPSHTGASFQSHQPHPFQAHSQSPHPNALHTVHHNNQALQPLQSQENQQGPVRHPQIMYTTQPRRVRYEPYGQQYQQNPPHGHQNNHHHM